MWGLGKETIVHRNYSKTTVFQFLGNELVAAGKPAADIQASMA